MWRNTCTFMQSRPAASLARKRRRRRGACLWVAAAFLTYMLCHRKSNTPSSCGILTPALCFSQGLNIRKNTSTEYGALTREDESGLFDSSTSLARDLNFDVRAGVGTRRGGELLIGIHGGTKASSPQGWFAEHFWRWLPERLLNIFLRRFDHGLEPSTTLRFSPEGWSAVLRCSKALLVDAATREASPSADGTGIDVHVESSAERRWLPDEFDVFQSIRSKTSESSPLFLRHRAELVVGPKAQAKYVNFSLPVGLLFGAELCPQMRGKSTQSSATAIGPLRVYAQVHQPGVRNLSGIVLDGHLDDARVGTIQGHMRHSWSKRRASWALQHLRTHGAVPLPRTVREALHAAFGRGGDSARSPTITASTRMRAGSAGASASLGLQSADSLSGVLDYGAGVELGSSGWGARLRLTRGGRFRESGKQCYTLVANAAWGERASLDHELKWTLADGQGVFAKMADGPQGPRFRCGLEVR